MRREATRILGDHVFCTWYLFFYILFCLEATYFIQRLGWFYSCWAKHIIFMIFVHFYIKRKSSVFDCNILVGVIQGKNTKSHSLLSTCLWTFSNGILFNTVNVKYIVRRKIETFLHSPYWCTSACHVIKTACFVANAIAF